MLLIPPMTHGSELLPPPHSRSRWAHALLLGAAGLVGKGNDVANILIGGAGNDTLNGGAGIDKSVYSGSSKDYKVTLSSNGQIGIADTSANRDGTDVLKGVERISFADTSLAFDISGNAGSRRSDCQKCL